MKKIYWELYTMYLFQVVAPNNAADKSKIEESSLNINNVLGLQNQAYLRKLYIMSLKQPTEYSKMQAELILRLKDNFFRDVYRGLFNLMSFGTDSVGTDQVLKDPAGLPLAPSVPSQEVNRIVLPICKALNSTLDEVIELILPNFLEKVADKRTAAIGQMQLDLAV